MPLYQHIVVALPSLSKAGLVDIFKRYSNTVLSSGGVVRGIEHHGIRPLAERARRLDVVFSLLSAPSSLPSSQRLIVFVSLSLLRFSDILRLFFESPPFFIHFDTNFELRRFR